MDFSDLRWAGAFWYWFHYGGDTSVISDTLRNGPTLKPHEAVYLAAILDGSINPIKRTGGTSYRTGEHKRNVASLYIRPLFERVLRVRKWQKQRNPSLNINPREEAFEYVSERFGGKRNLTSPSKVKTIIENGYPPLDFDAEFRESWRLALEKKPK